MARAYVVSMVKRSPFEDDVAMTMTRVSVVLARDRRAGDDEGRRPVPATRVGRHVR